VSSLDMLLLRRSVVRAMHSSRSGPGKDVGPQASTE
jgi:hypothetical protein